MSEENPAETDPVLPHKSGIAKNKLPRLLIPMLEMSQKELRKIVQLLFPAKRVAAQGSLPVQQRSAQSIADQRRKSDPDEQAFVRESIICLYNKGFMQRDIAIEVGRHKSSVSRCIRRARTEGKINE